MARATTTNEIVTQDIPHTLPTTQESVVEVIRPGGRAPICLVCEHASANIPAGLNDLGLAPGARYSHAAWDIGARDLAIALAQRLDAPLVAARVSRLVYDCNRPPDAPDAIPAKTEWVDVPGNTDLTKGDRQARIASVYKPFRDMLWRRLDQFEIPPIMVTLHSFTPEWFGVPRNVELGLLHDSDDRLAKAMFAVAPQDLDVRLNVPYDASDGVTHTLREHAVPRGLQNVMIEIRNDLISGSTGIARFADILGDMLTRAMVREVAR